MSHVSALWLWLAAVLLCVGAVRSSRRLARDRVPGDPLPGITPVEFEEFRLGLDDFLEVETAEEGLGPAFNGTSCAVCHNVPAIGGARRRSPRCAPGGATRTANSWRSTPSGDTLFHLFSIPAHGCQPVDSGRRQRLRATSADPALRRRARRSDSRRDAAGARGSRSIATATASAAARRCVVDVAHRASGASGASAGRRSTRRCSRSAPTPIATRWASPTICFPQEVAVRRDRAERMRVCDPHPDPEDIRDPRTRRRGIDNFASFMRFLGAGRARADRRDRPRTASRSSPPSAAAACHVPALTTGPEREPAVRSQAGAALFRSAAARRRHRRRHPAGGRRARRDPHAGAVGAAAPASAAARRLRGTAEDAIGGTAARPSSRDAGSSSCRTRERAALLAFLRSL